MREEIEELKRKLKIANTRPRKEVTEGDVSEIDPIFQELEDEIRKRFSECVEMKKEITTLEKLRREASRVGKLESELDLLNDRHVKTADELNRMRSEYEDKIRSHERFRRASIANEASLRDEMKRLKDLSELEKDSNDLKRHLEVFTFFFFFFFFSTRTNNNNNITLQEARRHVRSSV